MVTPRRGPPIGSGASASLFQDAQHAGHLELLPWLALRALQEELLPALPGVALQGDQRGHTVVVHEAYRGDVDTDALHSVVDVMLFEGSPDLLGPDPSGEVSAQLEDDEVIFPLDDLVGQTCRHGEPPERGSPHRASQPAPAPRTGLGAIGDAPSVLKLLAFPGP